MSEKKEYDSYEMVTTDQGILLDEIRDMEAHSVYYIDMDELYMKLRNEASVVGQQR